MIQRFDELRDRAKQTFADGDLPGALGLFQEAEDLALEHGDQVLADRAFCNRCAVLIELDQSADQIPKLKQILLRSTDTLNRYLAAYHTAVAYDIDSEVESARSYARRAFELTSGLDDPEITAASSYLLGTLALRSSSLDEAEAAICASIEAHRDLDGYNKIYEALAHDNLGYVYLCTGRIDDGVDLCEQALERLTALDADHSQHEVLQDLCYGYILLDRLAEAQNRGERALDLALETEDELVVKNCLFLLSEVAVRRGDTFRARRYLRELTDYYPEVGVSEEIIDVFLETDLTTVVNLRG